MQLAPDRREPVVVLTAAQGARPVPGGERRRLVKEEQLGVPSWLHQRRAAPAAELQPARDAPPAVVSAPNPAGRVMQAAAVSVHEPTVGRRDQLAQWGDAVLARHREWPSPGDNTYGCAVFSTCRGDSED